MKSAFVVSATALMLFSSAVLAQETRDTRKGKVFVNGKGLTMYHYAKDTPGKSNCNDDCTRNMKPVPAGANPTPIGDWTPVTRDDGTKMWAYKGKPVYTYIEDDIPGDVGGDGFGGGDWKVATP